MATLYSDWHALILEELGHSLKGMREDQVGRLLDAILSAEKVFVVGAGRMGILLSTFAMRLTHLGISSFIVGSACCPHAGSRDLLIVASSSGETPTIREVVRKAASENVTIAAITASPESSIAAMAAIIVRIEAPSSLEEREAEGALLSKQPMKTLFEQTLFIALEAMVLALMRMSGQSSSDLARRHSNLE